MATIKQSTLGMREKTVSALSEEDKAKAGKIFQLITGMENSNFSKEVSTMLNSLDGKVQAISAILDKAGAEKGILVKAWKENKAEILANLLNRTYQRLALIKESGIKLPETETAAETEDIVVSV